MACKGTQCRRGLSDPHGKGASCEKIIAARVNSKCRMRIVSLHRGMSYFDIVNGRDGLCMSLIAVDITLIVVNHWLRITATCRQRPILAQNASALLQPCAYVRVPSPRTLMSIGKHMFDSIDRVDARLTPRHVCT